MLEVTAGRGDKVRKATAEVTFEVAGPNRAPVAEIFLPEPKVEKGQPVTLDGSRSRDPDGDKLEYTWGWSGKGLRASKWALQEGPRAQFIPDQEGTYGIQLVVSDGKLKSDPCEVNVTVLPANRPPSVRVPALMEGAVGEPLRIEATATDPDNDRVEIAWSVVEPKNLKLPDLSVREWAVFLPLIAWAVWIGVYPKPYFDVLEKPVTQIVERVRPGYFTQSHQAAASEVTVR